MGFSKMNVLTKEECESRQHILHDHYTGTVDMEAKCMVDMINQHIIPTLKAAIAEIHAAEDSYKAAQLSRVLRLETMIDIRAICDAAEEVVPADLWTLATYKELMFLDSHTTVPAEADTQFYDE